MTKNITFTDHSDSNFNIYCKDVRKYDTLEQENELSLLERAQQGDMKARELAINSNLAYVISVAKEYQGLGVNIKDLIQAGNEGLIEAANTFNPSLGYRFITHADSNIRKNIMLELGERFLIHVPENEYRAMKACKQRNIEEDLYYNRDIDDYEYTPFITIDSLDMSTDENDEHGSLTDLPDNNYSPELLCEQQSEMDYILAKIGSLPAKQAKAVSMALGIDNGFECALETIADELSVSIEGARLLSNKGLSSLKKSLEEHNYDPAA